MNQQSLFEKKQKKRYTRTRHGGQDAEGVRKLERPLSSKKWIHLVLKSNKARGKLSLLNAPNRIFIRTLISEKAERFGVVVGDYANVGNHLHLKLKAGSRVQFQMFLRSICGRIARHVTGARRGRAFGRFWNGLAFTRVLTSRLEEFRIRGYFSANRVEALAGEDKCAEFLSDFNEWLRRVRARDTVRPRRLSFEDGAPG